VTLGLGERPGRSGRGMLSARAAEDPLLVPIRGRRSSVILNLSPYNKRSISLVCRSKTNRRSPCSGSGHGT